MQTLTIANSGTNGNAPPEASLTVRVIIDGTTHAAFPGERLIDAINRANVALSQVCYHPQVGRQAAGPDAQMRILNIAYFHRIQKPSTQRDRRCE